MTDPMNTKPAYQAHGRSGASGGEFRPARVHNKEKPSDSYREFVENAPDDVRGFLEAAEEWTRTGSFRRSLKETGEVLIYGQGDKLIVEYPDGRKRIFPEKTPLQEIRAAIDEYHKANPPKGGKRDRKNARP